MFVAPTGVGKMHLALNLLENEYKNHSDFIIIWNDPDVIPIELDNN